MTINKINVNGTEYDLDVLIDGSSVGTVLNSTATVALGAYRGKVFAGTTGTAAGTAAKAVTVDDSLWNLLAGDLLLLTSTYTNSAASATFAVNSGTAKAVKYAGAAIAAPNLDKAGNASSPQLYIYDGTSWVWLSGTSISANRLNNTSKVGDANKPVYFTADGVPAAISYTIDKSVPSNAVFTDTDTKVTSVGNHYAPSADSNSELTASLSGSAGSYAINTEYTVLTGVKAQRDAKGHVTGLTYTAQKVKDTNTTYGSGTTEQLNTGTDTSNKVWPAKQIADYVKGMVTNATHYKGGFNASSTDGTIGSGSNTLKSVANAIGDVYTVTTAGTFLGTALQVGDSIMFKNAVAAGTAPVADDVAIVQGTVNVATGTSALAWNSEVTLATVEGTAIKAKLPANPNTNTTYKLNINGTDNGGGSTSLGTVYAPTTAGSNGQFLAANSSGIPTWVGNPNTDTKVTAVGNHYTPSADSNAELTASLSGTAGAYALNTEYTVLTGVKAQRDAKGHVTGLTYTAQKVKDTNNTYTGYNLAFQNSAGTTVDTYKALTSPNKTLKAGSNVTMTASSNVITISATNTTYSNATQSAAGLMSAADKTKLDNITMSVSDGVLTITNQAVS